MQFYSRVFCCAKGGQVCTDLDITLWNRALQSTKPNYSGHKSPRPFFLLLIIYCLHSPNLSVISCFLGLGWFNIIPTPIGSLAWTRLLGTLELSYQGLNCFSYLCLFVIWILFAPDPLGVLYAVQLIESG